MQPESLVKVTRPLIMKTNKVVFAETWCTLEITGPLRKSAASLAKPTRSFTTAARNNNHLLSFDLCRESNGGH